MKLKDVFNLITDVFCTIAKINPQSKYDTFILYDDWRNTEDELEIIMQMYGDYPVKDITCWDFGPTIILTIDNP